MSKTVLTLLRLPAGSLRLETAYVLPGRPEDSPIPAPRIIFDLDNIRISHGDPGQPPPTDPPDPSDIHLLADRATLCAGAWEQRAPRLFRISAAVPTVIRVHSSREWILHAADRTVCIYEVTWKYPPIRSWAAAIPVAAWVMQRLQELCDGGFPDALQAIGLLTRHGLPATGKGTSFVLAQIRSRQFGAWIPHARQWLASIQTFDLTALEEELVQEADTCRAQLLRLERWTEEEQQNQIPDICLQRDRLESFVHALRLTRTSMRPTGDALTSALDTLDREGDTREDAIGEVLTGLPETAVPEPLRQAGPVWWCR